MSILEFVSNFFCSLALFRLDSSLTDQFIYSFFLEKYVFTTISNIIHLHTCTLTLLNELWLNILKSIDLICFVHEHQILHPPPFLYDTNFLQPIQNIILFQKHLRQKYYSSKTLIIFGYLGNYFSFYFKNTCVKNVVVLEFWYFSAIYSLFFMVRVDMDLKIAEIQRDTTTAYMIMCRQSSPSFWIK